MDSAEQYHKARRNLVFFMGLLLLSHFVGVSQRNESLTVVPFELARPDLISPVLAVVVIYSIYNLGICWALLDDTHRNSRFRLADFAIVVFLAFCSIAAVVFVPPHIDVAFDLKAAILSGAPAAIAGAAAVVGLFIAVRMQRRLAMEIVERRIQNALLGGKWILNYNPKVASGTKEISFLPDGTIGEGRNNNEHTWTIDNGRLVIWRDNGELQNRFAFNEPAKRFTSLNPEDAAAVRRGIRGQYIVAAETPKDAAAALENPRARA